MSQDLFAAFGDTPSRSTTVQGDTANKTWSNGTGNLLSSGANLTAQSRDNGGSDSTPAVLEEDDDDFGDFEDAAVIQTPAEKLPAKSVPFERPQKAPSPFPPKAQKKSEPEPQQDSKIGKHPFAGHMDFLFDAGEDEYDAGADDLESLANNPEAAMAYSKRLIAEQQAQSNSSKAPIAPSSQHSTHTRTISTASSHPFNHARTESQGRAGKLTKSPPKVQSKPQVQTAVNPPPARAKLRKKSGYAPTQNASVFFDADNLSEGDDDDDFGDFEAGPAISISSVTSAPPPKQQAEAPLPDMDLLGLDEPARPKTLGQVGRTRSASMRAADQILGPPKTKEGHLIDDNSWADFEATEPQPAQSSAVMPVSVRVGADDDGWDDLEEADPANMPAVQSPSSVLSPSSTPQAPHPTLHSRAASESLVPPTNIPPPALLLSIFPPIFSAAQDAIFVPLSRLNSTQRQELLSHHATHLFLRNYLTSAIVLAHIVAGRKLRWKRDQILSQSMRIGPAAAGGRGGMKLAGVDKSEVTKEDREVLDAVKAWKSQVGKLRGALATASTGGNVKFPPVPDITETMPVKTLKSIEGGFVAPHACALCGLKREERVQKVDIDIDDSFGEWWVNGMDMHVTCRTWWEENNAKLRSR